MSIFVDAYARDASPKAPRAELGPNVRKLGAVLSQILAILLRIPAKS